MNAFWTRFEVQRKSLSLTRSDVSIRTDIPIGTLNSWISRGTSYPNARDASKLAAALDISVEWLLTGHEYEHEQDDSVIAVILDDPRLHAIVSTLPTLNDQELHAIEALIAALETKQLPIKD